jgi:hypothetical protein
MQKKFPFSFAFALASALCALPAAGQGTAWRPGWYIEASGGEARTSKDLVTNRESTIVNASAIHSDFDRTDAAWKAGVGMRLLPWLAVEANYADLGRVHVHTSFLGGAPALPAEFVLDRKISGFGADAVFSAPIGRGFAIYGRAGAFRAHLESNARLAGNVVFTNGNNGDTERSSTLNETVGRFGAGLHWRLWANGGMHIEYERYTKIGKAFAIGGSGTTGEADTDVAWIGVSQSF